MAALPYMQLYVADYLADTMHLTAEEHGAYLLLIFNYWQTGKPIPKKRLTKIARVSNERWPAVEDSLSEFFTDNGTEWEHKRIEADLAMVEEAQSQRAKAGKASAEARKRANATKKKQEFNDRSTTVANPLQQEGDENPTNKETDTDTDKKQSNPPVSPQGEPGPEKPKPKRPKKTQIPPDFELTDERRRKAETFWHDRGRHDLDTTFEFHRFTNHHIANGKTMANWDAAWTTWYTNAVKFNRPLGPAGNHHETNQRPDTSAAGRVRENVRREREADAARAAAEQRYTPADPNFVDHDVLDVWP